MEKNNNYHLTFLKGENVESIAFSSQPEYFQNMNTFDRIVRPYDTNNIRSFILDQFPVKYVCKIQQTLNEIYAQPFFPFFMKDTWYIAICKNQYEGGMPHTLGNVIILPEQTFTSSHFRETLLHERIHILQKSYPAMFETLYTTYWGYRKIPSFSISPSLLLLTRSNPDTLSWWSINQHVPMVIYLRNPTTLRDTTNILMTLTTPPQVLLQDNTDWYQEMISGRQGCYQPEETSATLLASFWEEFLTQHKMTIQSALEDNLKKWIQKMV